METILERCKRLAIEAYTNGDDTNYLFFNEMTKMLNKLGTLVDEYSIEADLILLINKKLADIE